MTQKKPTKESKYQSNHYRFTAILEWYNKPFLDILVAAHGTKKNAVNYAIREAIAGINQRDNEVLRLKEIIRIREREIQQLKQELDTIKDDQNKPKDIEAKEVFESIFPNAKFTNRDGVAMLDFESIINEE